MWNRIRRGSAVSLVVLAMLTPLSACDELSNPLDVEGSSRIPAENVEIPENAALLVDGAIADFECAFAAYVVQSATVGEEFVYAQQTADRAPADRRSTIETDTRYSTFGCTALGIYGPLQTARNTAENVLGYLQGWTDEQVPNRQRLIATAAAYAGYSLVLLGEGFCTMAVSRINPDRSVNYGGEISRDSVWKLAVVRFTEAITAADAAQSVPGATTAEVAAALAIEQMATLGRARAHLNLGNYALARTDAATIPAGYVRNATYSDAIARRTNLVWSDNAVTNRASSVGDPYRTMADPRVPVVQATAAPTVSATGVQHWYQTKYTTGSSSIPLARYHEAQLIIAETHVRENNLALADPFIDASRTRGGQATPFVGADQAAYLAEVFDQRRRELFLEGHHLGDIIRFGYTPAPAAGTAYHFGGNYGSQLCFPLPSVEKLNNPLIGS
jgi:hypothetical protein